MAEEIGKAQGGYYDVSKIVATVGNKWIGVPWTVGGGLIAYRKSWFEEVGYNEFPGTWDAFHDAGLKLAQGDEETRAEMDNLDQIGDTVIDSLATYFAETHNRGIAFVEERFRCPRSDTSIPRPATCCCSSAR